MSALGSPVLINTNRAYWLSSIGSDVIHSTIVVDELDANVARVSTLIAENITASTVNVSSLNLETSDVSGMYVSSIRGNEAFFSSMTIASDLSGGLGYVRFHVDASGVQVDGDPIRFDNLVYLTSTINIVQVSTIVDTDIFAQRGFFSTLSTGNLTSGTSYLSSVICDDISGTNGSFDRLFVSSLEALDISGVAASNWSLYPTLNSSITFQPGFVLSNVGPSLYFAGVELTDISGGGQDWARFPAVSTVQMNNNTLVGLSTLQYQDGGRLYSLTGNNLFYNNQQITSGAGGAASNWAQFPANNNVNMNNSNLSNVNQIYGSNLALSGSNVTNGNTFTNSLGVGGLSLVPLASVNSLGQAVFQDVDVGNTTTSIGDLNVYGVNALPGDNALYVIGGTTLTGGLTAGVPVHGAEIGASPVLGVDSMRIDVLPVGIGINAATYIQLAAAGAGSFAAGGALSLAGGDYVEINTDDCRIINTTSGNQSTTLTVANIQMPGSVASTVPLQINNTAGGGINLVGTPGVGQIAGFSSIAGDRMISPLLSTININLSTINGVNWEDLSGGGGGPTVSSFQTLQTSTLKVSTIAGTFGNNTLIGSTLFVEGGLQFVGDATGTPGSGSRFLSSVRTINNIGQHLGVFVSTMDLIWNGGINPNGYIRVGGGGAFDSFFRTLNGIEGLSTSQVLANSTICGEITTSSIGAYGGLPLKVKNTLEFVGPNAVDNVDVINLNPPQIPALNIGASTINLVANNVFTTSLSTINHSTSAFSFSSATCSLSNTAYNFPLVIDYDSAGNTSTSGCAIRLQGHNLSAGAVRNELQMGFRASDGVNYIQAVWPGQNLEDLNIEGDPVRITDGLVSTIFNVEPYALQTTGGVSIGSSSAPVILSTNLLTIGSQTTLTSNSISTNSLLVSSINTHDARPAYTNNIQTSSMNLFQNSTTLMYWDSTTTNENINTSGYDTVVGLNGVFKIGASFQFLETGAPTEVEYFILKNDNIISQAGGITEVTNNQEIIQYFEVLEPLVNGDKIQVGCFTTGANLYVSTINGNVLQSPAVIMTMYKID